MLATVRAAWRRHWQGEAASISAKAAVAGAGQAPAQAPSVSPETLQPYRATSMAHPAALAPGLQQLAHLHSKLELKPHDVNLQQDSDGQRKEVLQQPVQQQQPGVEQTPFHYLWQHQSQPLYQTDITEIRDALTESRIQPQQQQSDQDHHPLLQQHAESLLLQPDPFPQHVVHQHLARPGNPHQGPASTATAGWTADRTMKGQRHEQESQLKLAKQALRLAQQQAEQAWAKAAATLGERTDHFLAKAGAWVADAGSAGTQQVEQVRQRAEEVQRQALRSAKTAEQRAQNKLRQAQKKAESIVEKARLKASWHLEKARQAAEAEASKARKYAANKFEEAYSSNFFEAWRF